MAWGWGKDLTLNRVTCCLGTWISQSSDGQREIKEERPQVWQPRNSFRNLSRGVSWSKVATYTVKSSLSMLGYYKVYNWMCSSFFLFPSVSSFSWDKGLKLNLVLTNWNNGHYEVHRAAPCSSLGCRPGATDHTCADSAGVRAAGHTTFSPRDSTAK